MKKILLIILCLSSYSLGFSWEKFYSVSGGCEILFPNKPHHIKQVVPLKESNSFLNYDVYLSFLDEKNSVCMMIVANFPNKIDISKQKDSLEGFLNGILNHKEEKKLIFANYCEFNKLQALEFLIENQDRYFKGKAFVLGDKLYLISMEYDINLNLDESFEKYANSFIFK
ncbi:MAG: hypothetical protein WCT85_05750 [Parachlamydiales bacterium]|jgi:hypothetical protein